MHSRGGSSREPFRLIIIVNTDWHAAQMLNFPEEYKPNNLEGYHTYLVSVGALLNKEDEVGARAVPAVSLTKE